MIVGGREFNLSKEEVEARMKGQTPELIQKHVVEIIGTVFPPKQVLGHVTGWPRTSFTTMEAQRVLTRLGFVCREARDRRWEWTDGSSSDEEFTVTDQRDRVAALEAAMATAQAAITGLDARVRILERSI